MKSKVIIGSLMTSVILISGLAPVFVNADVLSPASNVSQISSNNDEINENFVISGDTLSTVISEDSSFGKDSITEEQQALSDSISNFYSLSDSGEVEFNASKSDLMDLGLSEEDSNWILEEAQENEALPGRSRGFVGLHINLGKATRAKGANIAAAFVTGYVAFYLKQFAVTPVTAGVVGVISLGVGASVRYAVSRGITRVSVGVNIPGISKAFSVATP